MLDPTVHDRLRLGTHTHQTKHAFSLIEIILHPVFRLYGTKCQLEEGQRYTE